MRFAEVHDVVGAAGRLFWSLVEFTPRIFAIFGLGRIASGYGNDLDRAHSVSYQSLTRKLSKAEYSNKHESWRTSVWGFSLLNAAVPKTFGTNDFFFSLVTARTLSSILASFNLLGEIHVES
jgi:hypothetical protein